MYQALSAARAAAEARDPEKATRALSALSDIVARESRAGHLSAADERALRTGIAQARRRVVLDVTTPPPQPTPPPGDRAGYARSATDQKEDKPDKAAQGDKDKDAKGNNPEKEAKGDKPEKDQTAMATAEAAA